MDVFQAKLERKGADIGLLLLRVTLGLAMLLAHGIGKWHKLFGADEIQFRDPFGIGAVSSLSLAVFAEVICALFLIFGLLTRWSLIPLIITMLVAVFSVHINDDFGTMEKAIIYGIGFLTLFLTGPGAYSFDAFLNKKGNFSKIK